MRTLALVTLGALTGYALAHLLVLATVGREAHAPGGHGGCGSRIYTDGRWRDVEEVAYG